MGTTKQKYVALFFLVKKVTKVTRKGENYTGYGTRRVPTTFDVYLFLEFTIGGYLNKFLAGGLEDRLYAAKCFDASLQ